MDTAYLEIGDLLLAAERILGHPPEIRDRGLLESALHRPQSTWFGEDVYPDLDQKAAALLLSLVGNHSLIDGNKRQVRHEVACSKWITVMEDLMVT